LTLEVGFYPSTTELELFPWYGHLSAISECMLYNGLSTTGSSRTQRNIERCRTSVDTGNGTQIAEIFSVGEEGSREIFGITPSQCFGESRNTTWSY